MYQEDTNLMTSVLPDGQSVRGSDRGGCGCGCNGTNDATRLPADMSKAVLGELPIAMAYVPPQKWRKILEPDAALREGTMFEELALPFTAGRAGTGCKGGFYG